MPHTFLTGAAFNYLLLAGAVMLFAGVLSSKVSDRLGVPSLLMFLLVGMLAGSEGPGQIHFDNYQAAQFFGIIALSFIIFAGGLNTRWKEVRPVLVRGISLATVGVFLTAVLVGVFAVNVLNFSLLEGFLLGAIVSSTDAASVFALLRSRRVHLRESPRALLELESGSNDPMAVFLTLACIRLLTGESLTSQLIPAFFQEMVFGGVIGYLMGRLIVFALNHIKLEEEGLQPVINLSLVPLAYVLADFLGGNGFLSVYVAGLVVGNRRIFKKKTVMALHNYTAWLMQITMFLLLGLLATPSRIAGVFWPGVLTSLFLILVARPLSVFLTLMPSRAAIGEKTMVSFVGLRGAVPIILATFPFAANIEGAPVIFNIVFFIVITSLLFQGTLIPPVSRLLKMVVPLKQKKKAYPLEIADMEGFDAELVDIIIPYNAEAAGRPLMELEVPETSLVVLVTREDRFLIPSGKTVLKEGDAILVLTSRADLPHIRQIFMKQKEEVKKKP